MRPSKMVIFLFCLIFSVPVLSMDEQSVSRPKKHVSFGASADAGDKRSVPFPVDGVEYPKGKRFNKTYIELWNNGRVATTFSKEDIPQELAYESWLNANLEKAKKTADRALNSTRRGRAKFFEGGINMKIERGLLARVTYNEEETIAQRPLFNDFWEKEDAVWEEEQKKERRKAIERVRAIEAAKAQNQFKILSKISGRNAAFAHFSLLGGLWGRP